ncbi:N-acetylmuramoyl-L-alanine amidase [Candidatus Woesearchaeota archaeon]|nr:N-acetylmuramoyl-L-alanine amidase [Candidatus Woesearchaeota archaeon]MBW3006169.1 N-acetylmuramoyl-L-alanine amidase [Candidatus Woesearchaeota archaeon]
MISKKGSVMDIVLMPVFVTGVVLGLIFLTLLYKIGTIGSDMQFEKKGIAINSALLLTALQDVHSNVEYIYASMRPFVYDFQNNKVIVYQKKLNESGRGLYTFAEDGSLGRVIFIPNKLNGTKLPVPRIFFVKQGNEVTVDSPYVNKKFTPNLKLLECSLHKSKEKLSNILLDPGYGWDAVLAGQGSANPGSKGDVKGNIVESEINRVLAAKVLGYAKDVVADKSAHTRSLSRDSKADINERINVIEQGSSNSVISVHVGNYPDKSFNPVLAYINGDSDKIADSRKLACNILNQLSKKIPEITDLSIIPVSVEQLDMFEKDNPQRVLRKDKIGVQLVIGNIQMEDNNILANKLDEIAEAIKLGIEDFK